MLIKMFRTTSTIYLLDPLAILELGTSIFHKENERPQTATVTVRFFRHSQVTVPPWSIGSPDL